MKLYTWREDGFHWVNGIPYNYPPPGTYIGPNASYYVLVINRDGDWFKDREDGGRDRVDLVSVHAGGEKRWKVEPWQLKHRLEQFGAIVEHFGLYSAR